MISRNHRFHGRNSLRYVYRNGATTRGPLLAIKSIVNEERDTYRLAVVVSRKVHKSAVARNRMRRRLYAAVRNLEGGITKPYDIVITVFQPTLIDEPSDRLAQQIRHQLTEAGVLAK
jgi:ribonuclease P protein component